MRAFDRKIIFGFILMMTGWMTSLVPLAHSGIPLPSMIFFGGLKNAEGRAITQGRLRFEFMPLAGGTPLTLQATLGALGPGVEFSLAVPLETAPVSDPGRYFAAGQSYAVQVFLNDEEMGLNQMPDLIVAQAGALVGPLDFSVAPTVPVLEVSQDINFEHLLVNTYVERTLLIHNIGSGVLTGRVLMDRGIYFKITMGGIPVSQVALNLPAGESREITIRFHPTVSGSNLFDTVILETNAGDITREVRGSASQVTATPTLSPTPSLTPTETPEPTITMTPSITPTIPATPTPSPEPTIPPEIDVDCDGFISAEDLLVFLNAWRQKSVESSSLDFNQDGVIDWQDIMAFSLFWTPPQVIHSIAVSDATEAWEIRLTGELPGSNYCEIHESSISYQIIEKISIGDIPLRDESLNEYLLNIFFSFRLEACGCTNDKPEKNRFLFAEGEPTPVDIALMIPKPLPDGRYQIQVFANGTLQKPSALFEALE